MASKTPHRRDCDSVKKAPIWAWHGGTPDHGSKRQRAIFEVLRRVPDAVLTQLNDKAETFCWLVPDECQSAAVHTFRKTRVLYLGYALERSPLAVLIATAANELAHIALDHGILEVDDEKHRQQEEEARRLAIEWGFEREEQMWEKTRCAQIERVFAERLQKTP